MLYINKYVCIQKKLFRCIVFLAEVLNISNFFHWIMEIRVTEVGLYKYSWKVPFPLSLARRNNTYKYLRNL